MILFIFSLNIFAQNNCYKETTVWEAIGWSSGSGISLGAHDAYAKDACVTFNGKEYLSNINANVWSPTAYPAGWRLK